MDEKESNKKEAEVVAVLRSVVQSAKGGVLVSNLQTEYEFLVGQKVPFKALGYPSLENMLESMPDIVKLSRNSCGETIVNAVADESTAHIASLISRQRNAKTNPRKVPHRRPATMSHYSKPQASQYLPRMNVKKQQPANLSRPPRVSQNNATLPKPTADGPPSVPRKMSLNRRQLPTRHRNLPPRLQTQWISSSPPSFEAAPNAPSTFLLKQSLPDSPPVLSPPPTPPPPLQSLSRTSPSSFTSSVVSLPASSISPPPLYCPSPVYDPLDVNASSHFLQDTASYRDIIDAYATSKGLKVTYRSLPLNPKEIPRTYVSTLMIAKQKFNSYPNDMPTIELAEEEAARVAAEALNLLAGKCENNKNRRLIKMDGNNLTITINSNEIEPLNCTGSREQGVKIPSVWKNICKHCTYSAMLTDRPPAGLKSVRTDCPNHPWLKGNSRGSKLICKRHCHHSCVQRSGSWMSWIGVISVSWIGNGNIVEGKTNGLWSMKVESVYKETYNEVLPSNWLDIISSNVTINNIGQNRSILYPMQRNHVVENNEDTQGRCEPEPLPLPDSECWDVFVSYLTSSVDVCIQLVEHSESYQNLVEEMQYYYENNGVMVRKVEDGKLYAVNNEDYWHRVRITNIMGNKAECYFVDHGDASIVDNGSLYELLPKFSSLPFQALHCQLDGLAEYAENKIMLHHLTDKDLLLGKTLVAKVVSREDPISLVFYDTTTDEDININEHLLKITEMDYITPKLPKVGGITKAYLSHVDQNGDAYVRIDGPALNLLKILMEEFHIQCKTSVEPATSVSNHKMYCINYMNHWYRAVVKSCPPRDVCSKEVEMLFVDYGNCSVVPLTNIYELGQLSDELTGLPFQALKCHLHGITPAENEMWSEETIKQLSKLAPETQILLLKVTTAATEDLPTTVELFKRIQPNDELVSINQTIALSDSLMSIKESSTINNGILTKRMNEHCLKPLNLRLDFLEEQMSSKLNISSPTQYTPLQEENKLPKHHSIITPDGSGQQVDDVLNLPSLVPATVPEMGEYFDVHIVNAAHPFNFTCQPYKEGTELDKLFKEMQLFYSSEDNTIDMDNCLLKSGQFYAGKNKNNEWLRVCVVNIYEEEDMVSVYFVDYGGYDMMGLPSLQPLWKYFRSLPFQAIVSKLYGIEPLHGDWNTDHCLQFKNLVEGKEFVSIIKAKSPDRIGLGGQELTLILIDTSHDDDVNINQLLISLKIAVPQTLKR